MPLPTELLSYIHGSVVSRTERTHVHDWLLGEYFVVDVRGELDLGGRGGGM